MTGIFHFYQMKYRRLHTKELEAVQDEFVQFLVSNTIVAEDWEQLKKESPDKANGLVDIFSDVFWEKALSKIRCLEIRKSHVLRVMIFHQEDVQMVELRLPPTSGLDLTHQGDIDGIANGSTDIAAHEPEMYLGGKKYDVDRNTDLFSFIEGGAMPCSENLYYGLLSMASDQSS